MNYLDVLSPMKPCLPILPAVVLCCLCVRADDVVGLMRVEAGMGARGADPIGTLDHPDRG